MATDAKVSYTDFDIHLLECQGISTEDEPEEYRSPLRGLFWAVILSAPIWFVIYRIVKAL